MLFHTDRAERLAAIADRLRMADNMTADAITAIFHEASGFVAPAQSRKVAWFSKLTEASAWIDAALALLEMELPRWKLRSLVYDEGQWHCAISLRREIPDWLDDAVETSHPNLTLAILMGVVEAMRRDIAISREARTPTRPNTWLKQSGTTDQDLICCDNFVCSRWGSAVGRKD